MLPLTQLNPALIFQTIFVTNTFTYIEGFMNGVVTSFYIFYLIKNGFASLFKKYILDLANIYICGPKGGYSGIKAH